MPHPALIAGAIGVVLLPTTLVAPLLVAQEAQGAAVACLAGESSPDSVFDDVSENVGGTELNAEQWANARTVVATGVKRGIPERGLIIAVAVAKAESDLIVLGHGDAAGPDSRGLFQQRSGWGNLATRLDPAGSSRLFYNALVSVKGWQKLEMGEVAYRVQRFQSNLKYRYSDNETFATGVVARAVAGSSNPAVKPSQAGTLVATDVVWPVGKGALGGLHPTGGRDMARAMSHPVVAAHAGTVAISADIPPQEGRRNSGGYGSYGRYVVITWKNAKGQWLGNLYGHMRTRKVAQGDTVAAGQLVGYVGSTGNSSGPHLHFELFSASSNTGSGKTGHDPLPWLSKGREPDVDALPVDDGGEVSAQECQEAGGITADLPQFGSGSGPYTDSAVPMRTKGVGYTPVQAAKRLVSWASQGRSGYAHLCLKLVDDAYGRTGDGAPTAIAQWYKAKAAGYAHPNDRNVPVGAHMFWWSDNSARHIATYIGGGKAVTNMSSEGGIVKVVPAQSLDSWGPYLGWAEPYYP